MPGPRPDPVPHGPTQLTILPTYRCTAACAQCCFESNPHVEGRIPIERLLDYIDQGAPVSPPRGLSSFSAAHAFCVGTSPVRPSAGPRGTAFWPRSVPTAT